MLKNAPDNPIESLLRAAGGTPDELAAVIDELTLEKTAPLIAEEIVARCLPPHDLALEILLEIHRGEESVEHTFAFREGRIEVTGGRTGDPGARLRFEAADLITALYGPPGRGGMTREVVSLLRPAGRGPVEDAIELFQVQVGYAEAVQVVLAACASDAPNLSDLSVKYGSDKWGFLHWFTEHYMRHIGHLTQDPVKLLEIGVGGYTDPTSGGASLRMWQRYFRRGRIYGLDVYDKSQIRGPRLRTIQGDQNDPEFLRELGERIGPLDVIVDDGSHVNEHVLTSFDALFPYLRNGGLYVIEDLDTTYWPGFGGAPPGEGDGRTTMERVKRLIDGIHYPEYRDTATYSPSLTERTISGIHCYRNIVFIEKGLNPEGEQPGWVPRDEV